MHGERLFLLVYEFVKARAPNYPVEHPWIFSNEGMREYLWSKKSHMLEKASVQALTAYLCDTLEKLLVFGEDGLDLSDPDTLKKELLKILQRLDPAFFEVEWTKTGLDTRAGQELLLADLRQMASNMKQGKPWHASLQVVSIGAVSGEKTRKVHVRSRSPIEQRDDCRRAKLVRPRYGALR